MENDIFLQHPWRLFGYGFAIGEALLYKFTQPWKDNSEAVAALYIIAHTLSAAYWSICLKTAFQVFLFHLFASVLIPYIVNFYVCKWVAELMYGLEWVPIPIRRWVPVIAGIVTIPFFLSYVDPFVHTLLSTPPEKLKKMILDAYKSIL